MGVITQLVHVTGATPAGCTESSNQQCRLHKVQLMKKGIAVTALPPELRNSKIVLSGRPCSTSFFRFVLTGVKVGLNSDGLAKRSLSYIIQNISSDKNVQGRKILSMSYV